MKKPILMVNGRYDYTFPRELSQDPLFRMLATPAADKSHVILDTPHDVTEQRPVLVKTVLNWLDKYLGAAAGYGNRTDLSSTLCGAGGTSSRTRQQIEDELLPEVQLRRAEFEGSVDGVSAINRSRNVDETRGGGTGCQSMLQ